MTADENTLSERVSNYYSVLSAAAKDLNSISDQLSKCIAEVDIALKRLNLGVVVWVPISGNSGMPEDSWYWSEDIGYAKMGSNWGICLRKVNGDYQHPDDEQEELWLFNEAPRTLRISAIGKIPDLLEKLSNEAVKTTRQISSRLSEAQAVADAVRGAAARRAEVTREISKPMTAVIKPGGPTADAIRDAVSQALSNAGHGTAAEITSGAKWHLDSVGIQIEAANVRSKMIKLIFNAAAEKVIRQELIRLGAPDRFIVLPGQTVEPSSSNSIPVSDEGRR